jgi:hypothetical protein
MGLAVSMTVHVAFYFMIEEEEEKYGKNARQMATLRVVCAYTQQNPAAHG